MNRLPVELLEHVLSLLDGATFCKIRRVCKLWRDLHDTLQDRLPVWKYCCLKEVHDDILLQMTSCTSVEELIEVYSLVSLHKCNTWEVWKTLYSSWYRTRFVGEWIPLETCIHIKGYEHKEGYITCAKILGEHLVVGCQDGYVAFVDSLTGEEDAHFPVKIMHNVDITDIIFLRLGTAAEFVKGLAFFNHVVTSSVWGNIKVTSLKDGVGTDTTNILSYIGSLDSWGHLVVIENNRYGSDQCELMAALKNKQDHFTLKHIKTIFPCDWGCSMSQLWKNKVLVGGFDQVLMKTLNIHESNADRKDNYSSGFEDVRCVMTHVEDKCVEALVYKAGIALCMTEDGFIHTSIDDGFTWASWNVMVEVGSKATKMTLWGTLLAVAFLSGQVNIYYMANKEDYMHNFIGCPSAVLHTDSRVCSHIDIGDDGDGPMVTIVTEAGIKVVRWFHPLKD